MAFEPQQFGKYTLFEKLAVGGMALIYRARIQGVKGFQKDLVIKQILPQYSGMSDFIEMFIDEAKIAVSLNHANVVPVYELGEIDGQLYIAMEYVAGHDLMRVLEVCEEKKVVFDPRLAAYVLIHVCRGLEYAHNKKDDETRAPLHIVHRDISPNNVILSHDGEVKIIDFGIAKATIKVSVTKFGTLKGKMIYMSPEQAAEQKLDHRSDVFSAGILLYEMVTGKKPYGGDDLSKMQEQVKKAIFPPPLEANPSLPKAMSDIVLRAMARDPADRFQTAFDFERALTDYLFSTHQNVYARDLSQFLTDLFAGATSTPDPERSSEVPTLRRARNLSIDVGDPESTQEPVTDPGIGMTPTEEGVVSPNEAETVVDVAAPAVAAAAPVVAVARMGDEEFQFEIPPPASAVGPARVRDTVLTRRAPSGVGVVPAADGVDDSTPARSPMPARAAPGDRTPVDRTPVSPPAAIDRTPVMALPDRTPVMALPDRTPVSAAPDRTPVTAIPSAATSPSPPVAPAAAAAPPSPPAAAIPAVAASAGTGVAGTATTSGPVASATASAAAVPVLPSTAPTPSQSRTRISDARDHALGRRAAPARADGPAEPKLEGRFESAQDFLANSFASYDQNPGLFLETTRLDTKLGIDLAVVLHFQKPPQSFLVHGRVKWHRTKEGSLKGRRLPPGMAIELVRDRDDDFNALFAYLGLFP